MDRAYSNYGHIELSCLRCGKRWEINKDSLLAKILNRIERKRNLGHFGKSLTNSILSKQEAS